MSENQYNFGVFGWELSHYIQNIDTSNLIDGKPIYYWVGKQDQQVPSDAGYVGVISSTNITVKDLTLMKNADGLVFAYTNSSRIENVNVSNNAGGIRLYESSGNLITNSTVNSNHCPGIELDESSGNTITNNNALNNKWGIFLRDSNNNIIMNNNALNNWDGIFLGRSSNNAITNNNANSNKHGIHLVSSNSNMITNNNASNNYDGLCSEGSSSNAIYLDNFIDNTDKVYSDEHSTNTWNSTEKITYTYKGNTYTSYLGNYWSDYEEEYPDANEIDSTGIWDTPYEIPGDAGDKDSYPLVAPFENYEIGRKGDFNGDGEIDIFDFVLFAAAYGSKLGDDNYDPVGDFDNNDRIDIFDFVLFAGVYGT